MSLVLLMLLSLWVPCATAAAPANAWWNTSYLYRQQISIPAGAAPLQDQYSLSFRLNHATLVATSPARSLANGNDVRIVRWNSATGTWTELDRVVDPTSAWNTPSTQIWFKTSSAIPQLTTEGDYYVYYGNSTAGTPPSNSANVFPLYDAFSANTLDATRWSWSGTPSAGGGVLSLQVGARFFSDTTFGTDTIWETSVRMPDLLPGGGSKFFWFWLASGSNNYTSTPNVGFFADVNDFYARARNSGTTQTTFAEGNVVAFQTFAFARDGSSTVRYFRNGNELTSVTTNVTTNSLPIQLYNDANGGRLMEYDWMRVRAYRFPEPTLALGPVEGVVAGSPYFTISHAGAAIHCADTEIEVTARNPDGSLNTTFSQQVTLTTNQSSGVWSKLAGAGSLLGGPSDDGVATYQWPAGQSTARFALGYRVSPSIIDVDVYQSNNTGVSDDDAEGPLSFSPSGFTLTPAALTNPVAGTLSTIPAQTSGVPFDVHIAAFGQTANDPECGIIESYNGNKALQFWSIYNNPGDGNTQPIVAGSVIPTSASSTRTVSFTAGQAIVSARYDDVGQLSIYVRDASVVPAAISGTTGAVVYRPASFRLSNIHRTGDGVTNPAAASALGTVFIAAGNAFSATVTALNSFGAATPNFGRETPAQGVELIPTLIAPVPGVNPAIHFTTGFGAFNNGVAHGSDFSWPEVGIITITPQVRGATYFDAGNVIGQTTGNVGRFVPDRFSVAANAPTFATGCGAGGFTYVGAPLLYGTAPVVVATAQAAGGTTTQNYRGDFFKFAHAAPFQRDYISPEELETALSTSDPAITQAGGTAILTFASDSGIKFKRSAPVVPFDADITLELTIADSDGVAYPSNPFIIGAGSGIAFSSGPQQRYGRLAMRNQVGSELVHLKGTLQAESFGANGFVLNAQDTCTAGITLSMAGPLSTGQTCVIDGSACVAGAPISQRFTSPPLTQPGDFNLWLRAPGTGIRGAVTVTAHAPSWLQYDWDASSTTLEDPSGHYVFGIYSGISPQRIYKREDIVR